MKNKLLITTALVATVFVANNVLAAETIMITEDATHTGSYSGYTTETDGGVFHNTAKLTIGSGSTFSGNSALNETHVTPSEQGGAIYSEGDDAKVIIGDNVTFENNKAYAGAAIYLNKGSDLEIGNNVKFINNNALCVGNGCDQTPRPAGAAISVVAKDGTSGKVTIGDNAVFSGNKAAWGGAIKMNQTTSEMTFGKNALFENNVAEGNYSLQGGAIYNKGKMTFGEGATFRGNKVIETEGNDGTGTGGAVVNQSGAILTFNGSSFENNIAVSDGGAIRNKGDLIFNSVNIFSGNQAGNKLNDISNTASITVNGSLELDGGISGTGTTTFADGSKLTVNAGTTAIANTIINQGATLNLKFDNGFTGEYNMLADGGSLDAQFKEYDKNNLYNIKAVEGKLGSYDITKKSTSEVAAATGANANQANAIAAVTSGESSNATFNTIANNINGMLQSSNAAEVKAGLDAVTALSPEAAPAVQSVSTENANQVFGAVGTRLSGGSVSTGGEGMSSGDNIFERAAMWVQTLFNKSKLDDTSKAKGFDADSNGIAFGAEKFINDDVKVGVGYAYTNTDIDGFMRSTDVDTHTAIVYGEYKPSNWYVNGIATYGWSDYSENKNVAGVGVKADYDVETFGLQAMTGYDMNIKGFGVTPEAGLRYVHISQDGYSDTADQKVSANDSDILTGVIGAKVSKNWELENGMNIRPEARVAATYDLMNDDVNSVVTLASGSSYSVKGEALDRFGMEFGAGVTADVNDNVELSLGYEGKFREDYQDHTGLLNAKYKF